LKDSACGGEHTLPLFCSEERSYATRYACVDLLILKEQKVKVIMEIEESNVKPIHIFGKFLTSAMAKYYIFGKEKYEMETREQNSAEKKKREREKEEFQYTFKREQQLLKDEFEDEKAKLEREIQLKREQMEKDLAEREKAISEKEGELNELRQKVDALPKELETAVNKAVKETAEKITTEATNKEQLLNKRI